MSTNRDADATPSPSPVGPVRATMLAFVAIVVTNAIVLARTEAPTQGWRLRGLHHVYQAGRLLALGLLVTGAVAVCRRFGLLAGRRGYLVLAGASLVVGALTLVEDLDGFAYTALPAAPQLALWGLVVVVAGGVVAAAFAGRWLARPWLRWGAVAAAIVGLFVNPHLLERGYPGAHLYLAFACIALFATAITDAPLPPWWSHVRTAMPWALASTIALFTIVVPPSNSLLIAMLRQEGDVVSPYIARLGEATGGSNASFPPRWEPWFRPRTEADAVPPSKSRLAPDDAIVILLTIDSLRADIPTEKKHDKQLPNLAKLRDRAVWFTQARAPGSQTVYSLAQMFMGTYFSQQSWTKHEGIRDLWPDDDATVRFPQVLTDAGVATYNVATAKWLVGELGIVRGFSEDEFVEPAKTRYALLSETLPRILDRLRTHQSGPLFIYTHALDAHYTVSPDRKRKGKKRYLDNLALVDEGVGELVAEIEKLGLSDRTFLIVSSDHGEAFGEHGTEHHRSTIYEELLRIPLFVVGPGLDARKVDTPVTLMDIGPTVLDLFGHPTPGHIIGESLVPALAGKDFEPTRPILAEGRLKKALIFPDDLKAIVDDRHHTSEVYDLAADPKEETNLVETSETKANDRLSVLRLFFDIHTNTEGGYEPPYRP